MGKAPDFVGIGAQRAGTSWIFACLHEHPGICMPRKEIHFFSRSRNWRKGRSWYETIFGECDSGQVKGEFSTSYLDDSDTPRRLAELYPGVKVIVSLRNPVTRAYSSYQNDLASGNISASISFSEAVRERPRYVNMGLYGKHLDRYLEVFDRDQLLLLRYEKSLAEPGEFISEIYNFLGVDEQFEPTFLHETVNPGHRPRHTWINRALVWISGLLRWGWLKPIWWLGKRSGVANMIRSLNSRGDGTEPRLAIPDEAIGDFKRDFDHLEALVDFDTSGWRNEIDSVRN